jgi:hypothetical protein
VTEAEYVDVSNLARLRTVQSAMSWLLPTNAAETAFLQEMQSNLRRWEMALENRLDGKVRGEACPECLGAPSDNPDDEIAEKSNVCPKGHTDADGDCSSTCYAENAGACPVGVPLNPLRAVEHTGSSPDEVTGPHNCAQSLGLDPKDVFLG